MAATSGLDAFQLARRQLELDRQRMWAFPWLAGRKRKLMQASPLGFLRGSARLFCEILQDNPGLAQGPGGRGWIAGDLHLENFGAYRHDNLIDSKMPKAVFNLNDFDEAVVGPWRYDLLRLLTSFLIAAQGLAPPEALKVSASEEIIESYVATAMQSAAVPRPPKAVRELMEKVRNRTRKQLLDARTRLVGGKRRLIRGKRYRSLGKELAAKARQAFAEYAKGLPERAAIPGALEILDVAFRIAGTGSLGLLRVAVLVKGKGGPNGAWLFDMKEEERYEGGGFPGSLVVGGNAADRSGGAGRSRLSSLPRGPSAADGHHPPRRPLDVRSPFGPPGGPGLHPRDGFRRA